MMKKKQITDISTKVLACTLAFSLCVSANSVQLGTQADSVVTLAQGSDAQSVNGNVTEGKAISELAEDGNGGIAVLAEDTDLQITNDSNANGAVQPLAEGEDATVYKYFPVTMYDYDATTFNKATQKLEIMNSNVVNQWKGFYFKRNQVYDAQLLQRQDLMEKVIPEFDEDGKITNLEEGRYILYAVRPGKTVTVGTGKDPVPEPEYTADDMLIESDDYSEAAEWIVSRTADGNYIFQDAQGRYLTIGKAQASATAEEIEDTSREISIIQHTARTEENGTETIVVDDAAIQLTVDLNGVAYMLNDHRRTGAQIFVGTAGTDYIDNSGNQSTGNAFYLYRLNRDVYEIDEELTVPDTGTANTEVNGHQGLAVEEGKYILEFRQSKTAIKTVWTEEGVILQDHNWNNGAVDDEKELNDATIWTIKKVEGKTNVYTFQDELGRYMSIGEEGKGTVSDEPMEFCFIQHSGNIWPECFKICTYDTISGENGGRLYISDWRAEEQHYFGGYKTIRTTDSGIAVYLKKVNDDSEAIAIKGSKQQSEKYALWNFSTGDYSIVYDGLVKDKLDSNGNIQFNSIEAGVFDLNKEIKTIYTNVGMPFEYKYLDDEDEDENASYMYTFDAAEMSARFVGEPASNKNLTPSKETQSWIRAGANRGAIWAPFNDVTGGIDVGDINYHFGMSATIPFTMTKDGEVKEGYGAESDDIKFSFSGDDDIWVFIDGQLVLDLGGIHNRVYGSMNFAENTWSLGQGADLGKDKGTTFLSKAQGSGKIFNEGDEKGKINMTREEFAASGEHQLSIFYLERGEGSSNCKISFNLPMNDYVSVTKKADQSISKDNEFDHNTTGEQLGIDRTPFRFTLHKKVGDADYAPVANTTYSLLDSKGNVVHVASTDNNGRFVLYNGQTARFVTNILEDVSYYVTEDATKGFSKSQYTYIPEVAKYSIDGVEDSQALSTELLVNPDEGNFENAIKSNEITVSGSEEDADSLQIICENYFDNSLPNPTILPNDDLIVIDYGLGVQIDPLYNDLWRGDKVELVSVTKGKYGTVTQEGNLIKYQLTEQFNQIETLEYEVKVTGDGGVEKTDKGTIYIVPATQMYYEENFSNLVTYKQGKANENWKLIGETQTDYQETGEVDINTYSPYGSDDAYESDSGDSNGSSMYINTEKGAAQFSYTFTGTGTAFFARMCDTSGYMRVILKKQKYVWETNDHYGTATITDTSSADGKGIKFDDFQTAHRYISESENSNWDGQAQLKDVAVTNGADYRLTFDYRSDRTKKVIVQTLMKGDQYSQIGYLSATNELQHCEVEFEAIDDKVQITLAFGAMSEDEDGTYDVEFSNLKLYKVNEDGTTTEVPLDEQVEKLFRDTKYDDTNNEGVVFYNIPVYNREDLEYGTYSVTVTIAKPYVNGKKRYGENFWLDGIRVYNPLGTSGHVPELANSAYSADGEANNTVITLRDKLITDDTITDENDKLEWFSEKFVLFTDTNGEMMSADDYKSIGPKEEVYLNNGQGISFSLQNWEVGSNKVYLGIKAPTGSGTVVINNKEMDIKNAADCYYSIEPMLSVGEDGKTYANFEIHAADGSLISLTNIKVTGRAQFAIYNISGPEKVKWSSTGYIGSSDLSTANQYKAVVASGAVDQIVGIQQFGGATGLGIYVRFMDTDFGEMTVNGQKMDVYRDGSGMILYLSNFGEKYNTVVVENSQGNEKAVLYVYNEKGV